MVVKLPFQPDPARIPHGHMHCKSTLSRVRVSADGFKVYKWCQPNECSSHSFLMPFRNSGLAYDLGWLRWSLHTPWPSKGPLFFPRTQPFPWSVRQGSPNTPRSASSTSEIVLITECMQFRIILIDPKTSDRFHSLNCLN